MIINLTEGFEPFGEGDVEFDELTFPSGVEPHIKVHTPPTDWDWATVCQANYTNEVQVQVLITIRIESINDIMRLLLATDAIKRNLTISIGVFFPYVPFARQDRVMVEGEPFSLKVFADLINSQNYEWVGFYDVHSDVAPALINHSYNFSNSKLLAKTIKETQHEMCDGFYVCAPDAGAYKKIYKICAEIGFEGEVLTCTKARDVKTGEIKHIEVNATDLGGKDVYIVDDICSKGGTFMLIAKRLKEINAGDIYLIVSHWENSADIDKLCSTGIKKIYATDSMGEVTLPLVWEKFQQIKLENLL